MASKDKLDQIVALKTAGLCSCYNKTVDCVGKTLVNVWKLYCETTTTSTKPIPGQKR